MKRRATLVCLNIFLFVFGLSLSVRAEAEWLEGWSYRIPVTVTNSGDTLSDYTLKVSLEGPLFSFSHAAPDGADLRLTDGDGTTPLPFWIETWDSVGEAAQVWVKVPQVPSGEKTVYAYYGNGSAVPAGDGSATFLFYDGFESGSQAKNAPEPLDTPTYDGSGHMVHPDVVYVPEGWGSPNAYTYWMAVTPYPWGNDDYENPSILASHDGIYWEVPPGLTNPLAPNPTDGHHCDTDGLIVNDEYLVYYVRGGTSLHTSYVQLMRSSDGVNWTGPQTVITAPDYLVSPTFLDDAGTLFCWYVDSPGCSASSSTVHRRASADGVNWGSPVDVDMVLPGYVIWHIDIQKTAGGYAMVAAAYPNDAGCGQCSLFFAESPDGLVWEVEPRPLLTANPIGWDNAEIYRSTFLMDGQDLRIWYSAHNTDGSWHVGYTEGLLQEFLDQTPSPWDSGRGDLIYTDEMARSGSYGLQATGGSVSPQLFKNLEGAYSANLYIYDDLAVTPSLMSLLRLWDYGNETYPLHAIGVGIWQGSTETHYTTHTENWSYTPTTIGRTEGWHKLTVRARETFCDLYVDETWVRSLDVLDEQDIKGISLDSYHGGTSWYDDIFVHTVADPEPGVSAGPEQSPGIELMAFHATGQNNAVQLQWETVSEVEVTGFDLWRSGEEAGTYVKITPDPLPGLGDPQSGAVYEYTDAGVTNGQSYFYKLECLKTVGASDFYGPEEAVPGSESWAAASADTMNTDTLLPSSSRRANLALILLVPPAVVLLMKRRLQRA